MDRGGRGTVLARQHVSDRQNAVPHQEAAMNRKNTEKLDPRVRLAVKKETLKDLTPKQSVRGGFIMKDTIIIRTSSR